MPQSGAGGGLARKSFREWIDYFHHRNVAIGRDSHRIASQGLRKEITNSVYLAKSASFFSRRPMDGTLLKEGMLRSLVRLVWDVDTRVQ